MAQPAAVPVSAPLRFGALTALFPHFVWRSLIGAIDVAWRAFHPQLPIRPGSTRIAIDLPDGGRVALGGELSLMPGTLAAGCDGDRLLLHVIDRNQNVEAAVRAEERRMRGTVEQARAGKRGA
jgi:multicomponent Na+:H+ antiporter subunit E